MHKGSCLCGGITFQVEGPLAAPDACHCTACRKTSGHFWASTDVRRDALQIEGPVRWFQSSKAVRRGFCAACGSSLFWDPIHRDTLAVAMGAFDDATQTSLGLHIFVAEKGDYYRLGDGVPQNPR